MHYDAYSETMSHLGDRKRLVQYSAQGQLFKVFVVLLTASFCIQLMII